jgi:hypothetical protein
MRVTQTLTVQCVNPVCAAHRHDLSHSRDMDVLWRDVQLSLVARSNLTIVQVQKPGGTRSYELKSQNLSTGGTLTSTNMSNVRRKGRNESASTYHRWNP